MTKVCDVCDSLYVPLQRPSRNCLWITISCSDCSQSLLLRDLCVVGGEGDWGEGKKKNVRERHEVKRGEERSFPLLPSFPARFLFFGHCNFLLEYPAGALRRREVLATESQHKQNAFLVNHFRIEFKMKLLFKVKILSPKSSTQPLFVSWETNLSLTFIPFSLNVNLNL